MIEVRCQHCQKRIGVPEKHAGKMAKCPGCKSPFRVPDLAQHVEEVFNFDVDQLVGDPLTLDPVTGQPAAPEPRTPTVVEPLSRGFRATAPPRTNRPGKTKPGKKPGVKSRKRKSSTSREDFEVDLEAWAGGCFASIGVGLVGTIVWLVLWGMFGEFGFVAWGIGALIGLVGGGIARNPLPIYWVFIASIAALSFVMVKLIMTWIMMFVSAGVAMFVEEPRFDPNFDKQSMALKETMLAEGAFDGSKEDFVRRQVDAFFGNQDPPEMNSELAWEMSAAIDEQVHGRISELSHQQRQELVKNAIADHPTWITRDHLYFAVIHQLLREDEIPTDELVQQARHELRSLTEDDAVYLRQLAPEELEQRKQQLRERAGQKYASMTESQLDQALRETIRNQPKWTPLPIQHYAVLDQMLADNQFDGELERFAQSNAADYFGEPNQHNFDNITNAYWDELADELAVAVNLELVNHDAAQRKELVNRARQRHPFWEGPEEFDPNAQEEFNELMTEIGDGTFWGCLFAVTGWMDLLWFVLSVSTAYGITRQFGLMGE